MNRRGFLKMLGLAAPVLAAKPTYFFAPPAGWTSTVSGIVVPRPNQLLTVEWVTARTLEILKKNLVLANAFSGKWEDDFARVFKSHHLGAA